MGKKSKRITGEKGLSQAQLAKEIGINQRTISQYETGIREPDIQGIKKLCAYFGVTAGYLLGMEA